MAGGAILHIAGVRPRVVGDGNLDMQFIGLDPADVHNLVAIEMTDPAGREPLRLCNAQGQRLRLKVGVNEIDEYFRINSISIFVKELWQDYPSVS